MSAGEGGGLPFYTLISVIIGSIVGFAALLTIVWNFSKTITTMKINLANQDKKHVEDINELKLRMEQSKTDRRDEIRDSLENQTKKFEIVQEQVDNIRSDVKDQSGRITTVLTKTEYIETQIKELKEAIKDQRDFITKWVQRVEDRIRDIVKFLMGFTKVIRNNGDNDGDVE